MNALSENDFKALLPGLKRGDAEAETTFFHYAYAYLMSAAHGFPQIKESDREDFALEVIERVLSKLDLYCPGKGGFRTWLFVMARHLAYDRGRKLRDGRDVLHGALSEQAFEWEGTQSRNHDEDSANDRADVIKLRAVLETLEPENRHLVLQLVSGQSAAEIGRELRLSPDTVRKRNSRLKKRIYLQFNNLP